MERRRACASASALQSEMKAPMLQFLPFVNSAPESSAPRVAIAEDDEDQRCALEQALKAEGFEVVTMEDGFELADYFLEGAEAHRPAAVIADVDMPGRSGIDAIAQVRRAGVSVPVFLVTGLRSPEVRRRAMLLGNTLVFEKPIDLTQLAHAVRALASLVPGSSS